MELFILVISLIILAETTVILFKNRLKFNTTKRKIYVDSCVLIDGRILNIAKTGFLDGDLVILKSVLLELQLISDSKDTEKRTRGRLGLEMVPELERVLNVNTEILDDGGESKIVDEQLLKYAKENKGLILTLDYNLIKVAEAEKIQTLNINDLALAVRAEFLPGETVDVKIVERGSNRGQGIGYLPDGTMVVVDKAANKLNKNLTVELTKFHETSAGKMIFARIAKS